MYKIFQSLAFRMDAEWVHEKTIKFMSLFPKTAIVFAQHEISSKYSIRIGSQIWSFPVGLAAGLDKNAEAINFLENLYFGAVEVGTVTPISQRGNDKPRLFRLKEEKSLRNKMGFNNHGMDTVSENVIKSFPLKKILGVNLGKNKDTPANVFEQDYVTLYKQFAGVANYLVINVSSPNTPGLRELQGKEFLAKLFTALEPLRQKEKVDLYLKIAPDMEESDLDQILEIITEKKVTGLIATNTTIIPSYGDGGISGFLLKEKAKKFRELVLSKIKNTSLEFIGVGGVDSYEDLKDFWKAGGKVMQIYTSFIYQGPNLLKQIKTEIDQDLEKFKLKDLTELIAHYNRYVHTFGTDCTNNQK
jgi:dihydroorotate dehydrogenase